MSQILERAKKLESDGDLRAAFTLYKEALSVLFEEKKATTDQTKLNILKLNLEKYLTHVEQLKAKLGEIEKAEEKPRTITIEDKATGYDYGSVFGPYLKGCARVELSDPYLGAHHQVRLLHCFAEMLVKNGISMLIIETSPDSNGTDEFKSFVNTFKQYLKLYTVSSATIHDREITFCQNREKGHGKWHARLGRGLDYFQRVDKYGIGWHDYALRPCRQCTIEISYKRFDLQEFNELKYLLTKINNISKECQQFYQQNRSKPAHCDSFMTSKLETLDGIEIRSTQKYAKATRKQAINQINAYTY